MVRPLFLPLLYPSPLYLLTNLLCFDLFAFPFGIFSPLLPLYVYYHLLSSVFPLLPPPPPPPPFFPSRFVNWICTCSIPPPLTYAFFFNPPTPLFATFLPPSLCLGRFSPLAYVFPLPPPPPLYILYLIYSYKFKEDYTSQVMESHYPAILIVDPFLLTCHLLWILDPKTTISQPISVIQTNTFGNINIPIPIPHPHPHPHLYSK